MTFLTPQDVAKILRISAPTVRKLINDKQLNAVQVGRTKRIDLGDFGRYLKRNGTITNASAISNEEVT